MLKTGGGSLSAELLAAECEKAWIHPEEKEETMQKWYDCLEEMEKEKREGRTWKQLHQQRVSQMIKSAEGNAGLLPKITKPSARRRGAQILKKKRMLSCWTDVKQRGEEWAKHGPMTKACRTWRASLGKMKN